MWPLLQVATSSQDRLLGNLRKSMWTVPGPARGVFKTPAFAVAAQPFVDRRPRDPACFCRTSCRPTMLEHPTDKQLPTQRRKTRPTMSHGRPPFGEVDEAPQTELGGLQLVNNLPGNYN